VSLQVRAELARDGIVGRETELAAVASFLDGTAARPPALVIDGEPGIGKTTIVRGALEQSSSAGLRVLAARPAAGEAELPYVGLGDLLGSVDPAALVSLASRQRAAIEAALAREGSSPKVDASPLSRGVLELLRLEGTNGDLLLAIDDVQWLDRPSLAALTFALRRLGGVPLRLLVAARTTDGVSAELPFGLADWESVSRVAVGPLSHRRRSTRGSSRPRRCYPTSGASGKPSPRLPNGGNCSQRSSTESGKTAASSSPSSHARRSSATSKRPNDSTASAQTGGVSIAGATGLEPATSGVTGQFGGHDGRQRGPVNGIICRDFLWSYPQDSAWLRRSSNPAFGPRVGQEMLSLRQKRTH